MSWLVPYFNLDAEQKEFVDNKDINRSNIWIKGFPGSGKSVLLAYTLRRIVNGTPNASVIVVVYTHSLIAMFNAAFKEMNLPKPIKVVTYFQFLKSCSTYDYILCDEVQDLTTQVLNDMRRRGKHVIVSGDENQSIYEGTVSPSEIDGLLGSENYTLHMIHRLTSDIINVVNRFLPKLQIFESKRDLTNGSVQVQLGEARNSEEETKYILKKAKRAVKIGDPVAVLLPTQKTIIAFINRVLTAEGKAQWQTQLNNYGKPDYDLLNNYLDRCGIPMQYVGNSYGSFVSSSNKINVMTYHSSKGLDFEHVFLPGLNNNLFISYNEDLSKTLFMVAMTRSKKNLYITYSGYKHTYLSNFASECKSFDIHDELQGQSALNNSSNIFGF